MLQKRGPGATRNRRQVCRPAAGWGRQRLLDERRVEFAASGLADARVNGIAERAGRQQATGLSLFRRQGRSLCRHLGIHLRRYPRARTGAAPGRTGAARAMAELAAFSFDYLAKHPEFIALLNDENVPDTRHIRRSKQLSKMNSPLFAVLAETLRTGVRTGSLRPGIDPLSPHVFRSPGCGISSSPTIAPCRRSSAVICEPGKPLRLIIGT